MSNTTPPLKVFIDVSGSTGNQPTYWLRVAEHVLRLMKEPNASFFAFDDGILYVTPTYLLERAVYRQGGGGTLTRLIAGKVSPGDRVVIVCDGRVDPMEVLSCDALLKNMPLSNVMVYFYNTGGEINLSVSTPFTRNAKEFAVHVEDNVVFNGDSSVPIDLKRFYDKPDVFLQEYEALRKQVLAKTLGRVNSALRIDLLNLQANLIAAVAREAATGNTGKYDALRTAIREDYPRAMALIQELVSPAAEMSTGARISECIQDMIRLCDSTDFSFANLKTPSRMLRATSVAPADVGQLPEETFTSTFECPITLDEALPLLLVTRGTPILQGVEKSKLEDILTNPLLVLRDPLLCEALAERLDHMVGLSACKELFTRGNVISPLTRKPIVAAFSTGTGKEHIKSNNAVLAELLFPGRKLVGLADLWMAVIYFTIRHHLPRLVDFLAPLGAHLCTRFRTHSTYITLSGLPLEPLVKAPTDIAIWYCVVSPFVTAADKTPTNRLRDFGVTGIYLLDLVDLLGYRYQREETLRWMSHYRAFGWMMNQAKTEGQEWFKILRAQYQNSTRLADGTLILLDGPATETTPPPLLSFAVVSGGPTPSLEDLMRLVLLVDVKAKTNAVYIPLLLAETKMPEYKRHYTYKDHDAPDVYMPPVDPATFRPYVNDRKTNEHWSAIAERLFGQRYLSLFNYFVDFVIAYQRYPKDEEEFILYLARKEQARLVNPSDTLPQHIRAYVHELFLRYEEVLGKDFKNVEVVRFLAVATPQSRLKKGEIMYMAGKPDKK
jgi:hypothetical protein